MVRFVFCFILIFAPALYAQEEAEVPAYSQSISVNIVNLYASVKDSKGRPVFGLKQEDFTLFENGKLQKITNFSADITEPLNIAFLLDVSGSMRMLDKLEIAKGLIRDIVNRLGPSDEAALMIFADGSVEMLVEFTTDKKKLLDRMDQLKAYGGTALRNAVAHCNRLLIENIGKKGVILLSDGVDTRSELSLAEAMSAAARVELPIYSFELVDSKWIEEGKEKSIDPEPLRAFSDATGGLYFALDPDSGRDMIRACDRIFEDLKYQYYIGYTPRGAHTSYGKLELRTKSKKHRVRVRYSVIHGG